MNQPVKAGRHPKGLYVLFFTEMWERFGYYLMVGILFLFLTNTSGKGLPKAMGSDVVGTFIALVYLTPFIGGLLADRYLGYIKSIFIGGSLMAAGYLTIALPGEYTAYISMGLIIVGNGFFKPNISTLLGNMYNREDLKPLKDNAYNIFYMGINIGAFFCNFIAAILRNRIGWQAAFSAAGVGLIIGLIALAINLKHIKEYDVKRPMQPEDMPTSKILGSVFLPMIIFAALGWIIPGNVFGSDSADAFILACVPVIVFYVGLWRKEKGQDKKGIGALLFVFAVSVIFWTIYNQNSTGLTIWAESHTDRSIPQFMEKPSDAVYALQNLETKPQLTDSLDSYMRVVTDDSGHAIKTMGPVADFVSGDRGKRAGEPPGGADNGVVASFLVRGVGAVSGDELVAQHAGILRRRPHRLSAPRNEGVEEVPEDGAPVDVEADQVRAEDAQTGGGVVLAAGVAAIEIRASEGIDSSGVGSAYSDDAGGAGDSEGELDGDGGAGEDAVIGPRVEPAELGDQLLLDERGDADPFRGVARVVQA